MAGELAVIKENWLELSDHARELPKPFEHEVLLMECHVAGTMYIDDVLAKAEKIVIGTPLVLRRDPKNECDKNAIGIYTTANEHIGWIPMKKNQVIARLMDAGKLMVAKVVKKELEDHWLNMRVEVFLKDI